MKLRKSHQGNISGIGKAGPQVAALGTWLKQSGLHHGANVELVLSTDILEGQPGPPLLVASATW